MESTKGIRLYNEIAKLQPETVIIFNHGLGMLDGSNLNISKAWPTDILTIERNLPRSTGGIKKWREVEGKDYYLPAEVCETFTDNWFFNEEYPYRSKEELIGIFLVANQRGANILFNVAPDKNGLIPEKEKELLLNVKKGLEYFNLL